MKAAAEWIEERFEDAKDLAVLVFVGIPMALDSGNKQTRGVLGGLIGLGLVLLLLLAIAWLYHVCTS